MNSIVVSGNLGKDPELKNLDSGKTVVNFSIADNVGKDKVVWWNCVAWERTADAIEKYFTKGDKIVVVGRREDRSYEDKDGNDRTSTELIVNSFDFGGKKNEGSNSSVTAPKVTSDKKPTNTEQEEEDDLPF